MPLGTESSKIIDALSRFCETHKDDPNLFPKRQDRKMNDNNIGCVISEHPEVTTTELSSLSEVGLYNA